MCHDKAMLDKVFPKVGKGVKVLPWKPHHCVVDLTATDQLAVEVSTLIQPRTQ